MKNIVLSLFVFGFVQVGHAETVPSCSFETMQPLVENGIMDYVVETMKKVDIEINVGSIAISYQGMMDFADHDFAGIKKEHGFKVNFETLLGTEMFALSTITELCDDGFFCYQEPLNYVVSLPEPKLEIVYDREGNIVGEKCIVLSHGGYNRDVVFVNAKTNKVVKGDLVSYSHAVMAIADVKK